VEPQPAIAGVAVARWLDAVPSRGHNRYRTACSTVLRKNPDDFAFHDNLRVDLVMQQQRGHMRGDVRGLRYGFTHTL